MARAGGVTGGARALIIAAVAGYGDCLSCAFERRPDVPPRERIYLDAHWRVAHAFGTAQPGWLVVLPRRHVLALDELSYAEAAALGPLLRAVTAALREVTGCAKTYVALFAEAEGSATCTSTSSPAPPAWTRSCAARGYSRCWAVIPPCMRQTATWTT